MPKNHPPSGALYPIRKVSEITGINPVTLRAWERRYGLIKPSRTPKGHRLYSDEQIALIERILSLVQQGVAIGQVKRLLHGQPAPTGSLSPLPPGEDDPWEHYRRRMRQAIAGFDDPGLDAAYNDCLSLYPIDLAARLLLRPLIDELAAPSDPLADGRRRFFQSYLRNKLGARFHHQNGQSRGPFLIGASLSGGTGELELLLLCLSAIPRGYRFLMLGEAEPGALPGIQAETGAAGIVLVADGGSLSDQRMMDLGRLGRRCTSPLFVGGRLTQRQRDSLTGYGVVPLSEDLSTAANTLDDRLKGVSAT